MAPPYGLILQDEDDFEAVRDALGMTVDQLSDDLIGAAWANPIGERFVQRRVPTWAAILQMTAPAAPVPSVVSQASSLVAATYFLVLVAKANSLGPSSPPSTEAQAIVTVSGGQVITLTAPAAPGIGSYDLYVGTAAGQEYLQQANLAPGQPFTLASYAITGQSVAFVAGDVVALKAAVASATAGAICKRLQLRQPEEFRTLDMAETVRVDWREEETAHMEDCSFHLGLISVYQLTPPAAAVAAHPGQQPTDPSYQQGTDPLAIPPAWPYGYSRY